jgi:glycosyltransferase involved in cell wall biosynthesis
MISPYYKPAYAYGGPVNSCASLCEGLVRQGVEVSVLTTNAGGAGRLEVPLGRAVDLHGVKVFYYPLRAKSYFYSPDLVRAVKENVGRHDVVILQALWTHPFIPGARECIRKQVPYIVTLRGQLLPWALEQGTLKKQIYLQLAGRKYLEAASGVHCTSGAEVSALKELGYRTRPFLMPNTIDARRFRQMPPPGSFQERLGCSYQGRSLLLVLGRLHRKKRVDIALQAFAKVAQAYPQARLVLAGPDEEGLAPELLEQAQALGLSERVHLTGLLDEKQVLAALGDSLLLMMPSEPRSENFGMSALEALAAGVPVLASEGVPLGHWAAENGAGLVVDCSVEAFARGLDQMLGNPGCLHHLGDTGRRLAEAHFDQDRVARRWITQLEAILNTGKPLPESVSLVTG